MASVGWERWEVGPLTGQPLRVVAGAVRRVEPGGRWTVESAVSSEVSFSGHRAAGLIRAVMVRQ